MKSLGTSNSRIWSMSWDILNDRHHHVIRLHNGRVRIGATPTVLCSHALDLGDAPGLRWTASRAPRLVTIVDFGNRAQAAALGRLFIKTLDQAPAMVQRRFRRSEGR